MELVETTFIAPLRKLILDFSQFGSLVENTIDLEQADNLHEYIIRPSFSVKLQDLHNEKTSTLECIQKFPRSEFSLMHTAFEDIRLQVAARLDLDSNKVKLDNNTNFGYLNAIK